MKGKIPYLSAISEENASVAQQLEKQIDTFVV